MGSIIDNLTNAINTWNEKLAEIWLLLTQTPQNFKGGNIWNVIVKIHGGLQAIGLALLVLFFAVGMVKTCSNLNEIKRPEQAIRLFLRFAIARGLVVYGMELMTKLFEIVQGITSQIMTTVGVGTATSTTYSSRNHRCSRGLWFFGKHTCLGGNTFRWYFHYDFVLCSHTYCLWSLLLNCICIRPFLLCHFLLLQEKVHSQ